MSVSDWLDLMPATVAYQTVTGRDAYGKPTYDTARDIRCRFTQKNVRVTSRITGDDVISSSNIWLAEALTAINIDDTFTLPDSSTPDIVNWETVSDESGTHHTKVYFK